MALTDQKEYISALNGQQMDDALTQMNQRVPEGWAVGTKDGVAVGSSSPFYHNNAKYYAQLAGTSQSSASTSQSSAAASAASAAASEAAAEKAAELAQSISGGQNLMYDYDANKQYIVTQSVKSGHFVLTFTEA